MTALPLDELSASVSPRDDLWGWVNGPWLDTDPIPADRARYGLSDAKRARIAVELRELVEHAGERAPGGAIATLHVLLADEDARRAAGTRPIIPELTALADARTPEDVLRIWGALQRDGVTGPFSVHVLPRDDDAREWQLSLFQGGMTLPVPPLYARHGDALVGHARALFEAAGMEPSAAEVAIGLERAIAAAAWDDPEGDDDAALHHPVSWADLAEFTGLPVAAYAEGLAVPAEHLTSAATWNVAQPSYARGLAALLRNRPVEEWREYLRWRVLDARASVLTPQLEEQHARFRDCVLAGQPEPAPAWRRRVATVQQALPMDLGRLWVETHVAPEARERTRALTEQLRRQLQRTLSDCAWLGAASTDVARQKLDAIVMNVGWPDEWETVDTLDARDPVDALRGCTRHDHDATLGLLRGPVDRGRWGPPPFVVNTFYHPFYNQVLIEAASLAPADALADLPVLLGQYGSIIAHELGHAFDSRGSARDDEGQLREWWTPEERAEFESRAQAVERQVDGYQPRGVTDAAIDGRKVGFECVAELIGLQLAWDAYSAATTEAERSERVAGYTGPERFFIAKAYGRRAADRPATARNRLASDVHPPFEVFANLARNLDGFHATFGTEPGDGMWLAPEDRVQIF